MLKALFGWWRRKRERGRRLREANLLAHHQPDASYQVYAPPPRNSGGHHTPPHQ